MDRNQGAPVLRIVTQAGFWDQLTFPFLDRFRERRAFSLAVPLREEHQSRLRADILFRVEARMVGHDAGRHCTGEA